MTKVRIGKNRWFNVNRRSLCDNCSIILCDQDRGVRIMSCERFRPVFTAFKKCPRCGAIFEVYSNIGSLDQDLCPSCNRYEGLPKGEDNCA